MADHQKELNRLEEEVRRREEAAKDWRKEAERLQREEYERHMETHSLLEDARKDAERLREERDDAWERIEALEQSLARAVDRLDEERHATLNLREALARVREVAERAHHGPNIKRILSILNPEGEK